MCCVLYNSSGGVSTCCNEEAASWPWLAERGMWLGGENDVADRYSRFEGKTGKREERSFSLSTRSRIRESVATKSKSNEG